MYPHEMGRADEVFILSHDFSWWCGRNILSTKVFGLWLLPGMRTSSKFRFEEGIEHPERTHNGAIASVSRVSPARGTWPLTER